MRGASREARLRAEIEGVLSESFLIYPEVFGLHCTGKRLRIDAVIEPRDPSGWKDEYPALGVEFKAPPESFDTRNFTRWCAQAVSYTHVEWEGWGRLMVFACPSPIDGLSPYGEGQTKRLMERVLGQLGVGDIANLDRYGWTIRLNGHRMWSQLEGVRDAARWSLRPKHGSR